LRGSFKELSKSMESDEMAMYEGVWGKMHVEYDIFKKPMDVTPYLKGLPNDRDSCPHWRIVLKGEMTIIYDGKTELPKQEMPTTSLQDTQPWQRQARKFGNSALMTGCKKPWE